jgi:uncharacterized protein YkwD
MTLVTPKILRIFAWAWAILFAAALVSVIIEKNSVPSPVLARPSVSKVSVSPQQVLDGTNSLRTRAGLPGLSPRADLCDLAGDILQKLKSDWQTGVFETATGNFYRLHPQYSNLSMQAAEISLDSPQKIAAWLDSRSVKSEILLPGYNSFCVAIDGFHAVQLLGTYLELSPVVPTPTSRPIPRDTESWGVSKQIDEHTWSIRVGQDDVMAKPEDVFTALNEYRRRYGSQPLHWDQKLADYAQSRAAFIDSKKDTDSHAGFLDFLEHQDGFNKLGFTALGENMSYGYRLSGVHLIEWIYAGDAPHNENQLDSKWNYVGIGVDGLANCLIFGTGKR